MKVILKQLLAHRGSVVAVSRINGLPIPQAATSDDTRDDLVDKHLSGELRLGAYTTIPGASLVRWGCFDLDGSGHADKNALQDPDAACDALEAKLLGQKIPVIRERSGGGGGWHLWVVFDRLVAARDVRDWMREQLRGLDVKTRAGAQLDPDYPKGIEIFPKQDVVNEGDHGNLVWLPAWGQAPDKNLYRDGAVVNPNELLPVYELKHRAPDEVRQDMSPNTTNIREKDVRGWLAVLDPDDYDLWLRVGMALNGWTKQGGGNGLALWVSWSKGSEKYEAGVCEAKWDSFRREVGGVSLASIRFEARKAGWCEIKRGSQVEIADHLLDGEVFDEVDLWRYDEHSGVWARVSAHEFARRVCDLDGLEIPPKDEKSKPKSINVGADMAIAVAKTATMRAEQINPGVWTSQVGFAVLNGWVTPRGLEPLRREHYARHQLAVAFDPQAKAPRWEQFLAESCDEASAKILQEFVGAALFGDATRYSRALVLWGDGGNGKSVFAQTITLLFGRSDTSSYTPHSFNDNGTKADLRTKRLNVVMELPERELLDVGSLKAIFTGDDISARRPYDVVPITFQSKAAHLFCCNVLPDTRSTDTGFWRRWLTVGFTRTPAKPDPYLKDKLASELAGILAWGVRGYARLQEQGDYSVSASAAAIRDTWSANTNPVQAFVTQTLTLDANAATGSVRVYEAYTDWCARTNRKPLSVVKFGTEIKRHVSQGRNSQGSFYLARVRPVSDWDLFV
jgi:P4 family phage/plasmid primase-like protien